MSTENTKHPLIGRRVRVSHQSRHYPNRFGVVVSLLGEDSLMVSLDAYKRAPSRRQAYRLTDLIVQPLHQPLHQPEQGNRHEQENRTHA